MSLTKKLMLVLIPGLVILIGLLGVLLFLPGGNEQVYVQQITQARKMVESGDYQKAIVYFQNAIKEDKTKEEPYIELANIYFSLNMRDEGIAILREGIQTTNSVKIIQVLNEYENSGDALTGEGEKPATLSKVTINSTYTDAFATYNYEKYSKECTLKNEQILSDKYVVSYVQFDAVFEYENTAENPVLDPSTNLPYPYARPTSIKVNKLGLLISGVDEGITVDKLKESGATEIKIQPFDKTIGSNYVTFNFNGVSFAVGCDENGNIKGDDTFNRIVPKPGQATSQKVTSKGKIIDATTGKTIGKAELIFHIGKNSPDGEEAEKMNITDGTYSVELDPGEYTLEINAEGYNKEYYDLFVSDSGSNKEETISVSPALVSNEIRFVLEWGATPNDLDSHLTGECKTNGSRSIDVSWRNKKARSGDKTIAELDLDDMSGYGPETTTLYDTNGTYEFKVHRYSGGGSLSTSGATVKIYTSSSSPIVVKVPNDVDDEWWTVCKVVNGEIKDINGITG